MKINFWLNGAKKEAEISPDTMLLEFLRSLGCYSVTVSYTHLTLPTNSRV